MEDPAVSVLVPTANRHRYIGETVRQFLEQDFGGAMELLLHDSTPRPYPFELPESTGQRRITYVHQPNIVTLGAKRNALNSLAKGAFVVCMDDDDVYYPTYVAECVRALREHAHPENNPVVARQYETLLYNALTNQFRIMKRKHPGGCVNSAMAYGSAFLKSHKYCNDDRISEERRFTSNFTARVCDLRIERVGIHVIHAQNTGNKENKGTPLAEPPSRFDRSFLERVHAAVPRVYWINLDGRKDRYRAFLNRCAHYLQHRVSAVSKPEEVAFDDSKCSIREIACFLSHIKAMRTYLRNETDKSPFAVICEDDLIVRNQKLFYEQIFYYRHTAPEDWEILQLHRISINRQEHYGRALGWSEWTNRMFSTAIYLIRREAASRLVETFSNLRDLRHLGRVVADNTIYSHARTYSADLPYFVTDHRSPSDINTRHYRNQQQNNAHIKSSSSRSCYPFGS